MSTCPRATMAIKSNLYANSKPKKKMLWRRAQRGTGFRTHLPSSFPVIVKLASALRLPHASKPIALEIAAVGCSFIERVPWNWSSLNRASHSCLRESKRSHPGGQNAMGMRIQLEWSSLAHHDHAVHTTGTGQPHAGSKGSGKPNIAQRPGNTS
jgi:hypothetical protein